MRARMPSRTMLTVLLGLTAFSVLFFSLVLNSGHGVAFGRWSSVDDVASSLFSAAGQTRETLLLWWSDHYQRAPTLVLGLVALVVFPVVAIVAAFLRSLSEGDEPLNDVTERTEHHTTGQSRAMPLPDRAASTSGKPVWPSRAILELRDPTGRRQPARFQLDRPVVQIGRSDDVDIVISDPTVHRHHACIHCTEDAEYMVTDLTAGSGNGVTVNGHPVLQHQIFNGDEIRLGRARLTFLTAQT